MRAKSAADSPRVYRAMDSVRNPLVPIVGGTLAGGVLGGMHAPKGKLLKYILGGAGSGALISGLAATGGAAGAAGADALTDATGVAGNSPAALAVQLGLPIAGAMGGGYLGVKGLQRINEELEHEPDADGDKNKHKKEKSAMALYDFGAACANTASRRKAEKNAGVGTTLGILGGLMSGRGDDKLRSAGRGAIKGFGVDAGAGVGAALGTGLGLVTGAPALGFVAGGVGGGMLGHSLASSAIGPYETEEEKFERMLSAREAAQEKMKTAYTFGAKVAQSACTPCAMPNGPTNKKHTTSASPAVLDAGQKSEEIGTPATTETEHSEAKAKQPEEGVKSALAFGKKVAVELSGPPIRLPNSLPAGGENNYSYNDWSNIGHLNHFSPQVTTVLRGGDAAPGSARAGYPLRVPMPQSEPEMRLPDPNGLPLLPNTPSTTNQMEQLRQQGIKNRGGSPGSMAALFPHQDSANWSNIYGDSPLSIADAVANDSSYLNPQPAAAAKPVATAASPQGGSQPGGAQASGTGSGGAQTAGAGTGGEQTGGWGNMLGYGAAGLGGLGLAAVIAHALSQKKRRRDEEDA